MLHKVHIGAFSESEHFNQRHVNLYTVLDITLGLSDKIYYKDSHMSCFFKIIFCVYTSQEDVYVVVNPLYFDNLEVFRRLILLFTVFLTILLLHRQRRSFKKYVFKSLIDAPKLFMQSVEKATSLLLHITDLKNPPNTWLKKCAKCFVILMQLQRWQWKHSKSTVFRLNFRASQIVTSLF